MDPGPDAIFIDAFTRSWRDLFFYAFTPFSVIRKCLHKIMTEGAEGIVIILFWPTQPWCPIALNMMVSTPTLLPLDILHLPYNSHKHPEHNTLRLLACQLSGDHLKAEEFRKMLSKSCWRHEENQLNRNITHILKDVILSVPKGVQIPIAKLKMKC